jgi:hypothetical protein
MSWHSDINGAEEVKATKLMRHRLMNSLRHTHICTEEELNTVMGSTLLGDTEQKFVPLVVKNVIVQHSQV